MSPTMRSSLPRVASTVCHVPSRACSCSPAASCCSTEISSKSVCSDTPHTAAPPEGSEGSEGGGISLGGYSSSRRREQLSERRIEHRPFRTSLPRPWVGRDGVGLEGTA
eukprot:scaffold100381_cov66-Phaeocystis_antarctica.AAC.8